jgi:hypothetical protein
MGECCAWVKVGLGLAHRTRVDARGAARVCHFLPRHSY